MEFRSDLPLYGYQVEQEAGEEVAYLNYLGAPFVPSLEDSEEVFERVLDVLIASPTVSRVVFVQQKNYSYGSHSVLLLSELAQLYNYLVQQERVLSSEKLAFQRSAYFSQRYAWMTSWLMLFKRDPVSAYVHIKRVIVEQRVLFDRLTASEKADQLYYLRLLEKILVFFEHTKFVQKLQLLLEGYKQGSREIYHNLFQSDVVPNFTFTRLVSTLPDDAEIFDQYTIASGSYDESLVTIMKMPRDTKLMYHVMPPEYTLSEDHLSLLYLARQVLIEHQPRAEEFVDTERTRQVFFNISRDLLQDLATSKNISLKYLELQRLATILVRHTIGFGIIEVLLQDPALQDIALNAPIALNPVFVRHQQHEECTTNILPSQEDANSWAAKFRMISGRPLDEANPILDTQLNIGKSSARIAIIQQPLSPRGLAYAIRRHREDPWTLPLFIQNKMLDPFAAGLMSFMIDGSRIMLIAGTRSSGKTSLLGSLMLEILPRYRILVIEDTLELPVDAMRMLNYNILRMKVRSSLLKTATEVSAADGIRTSLRLGDSSLIIGEVRSSETKALYEAMRVGALANVVAGTIHGASPYAVFDRVVNDLGVPITSFKATDLIVVANPLKSPDGLHSYKRVVQITEVRKHWTQDPLVEKGFVDLLKYDVEKDILKPTDALINGDSETIKAIAGNVRGWAGNWDAVYDNILMRGNVKKVILDTAMKTKKPELLEATFTTLANTMFHHISDQVTQEVGLPVSERVFPEWQKWLNSEVKMMKV